MPISGNEIIFAIVACAVVFFILSAVTCLLLIVKSQNQKRMLVEKKLLLDSFDKTLLQSQLEMQEQTFSIISRELHDNVGQLLSLAKVQLNIIEQTATYNAPMFLQVKENISYAMNDLRDIAKSLNSDLIQQIGLYTMLQQEMDRINRSGAIQALMYCHGEEQHMDHDRALILFRIIQECMQNIFKHAAATQMSVTLHYAGSQLKVLVADNGKGFNDATDTGTGLGLKNIHRRAMLIGGQVKVDSAAGEGTTVTIIIPDGPDNNSDRR
jgi:two-component system, NarL family, sensor kinase